MRNLLSFSEPSLWLILLSIFLIGLFLGFSFYQELKHFVINEKAVDLVEDSLEEIVVDDFNFTNSLHQCKVAVDELYYEILEDEGKSGFCSCDTTEFMQIQGKEAVGADTYRYLGDDIARYIENRVNELYAKGCLIH